MRSYQKEIERVKGLAGGTSIQDLLSKSCSEDILLAFDALTVVSRDMHRCHFGYLISPEIADRIQDNLWERITDYCNRRLGDDFLAPTHLLETILCVYEPEQAKAWIGNDILYQLDSQLEFDKDGLLVGPRDRVHFRKEGALTSDLFIQYNCLLPGIGMSGAFLEELLKFEDSLSMFPDHFGFAVDLDAVLGREYYRENYTKAYIRGPRGLSEAFLQDPLFPEDPSGTVTVHERVSDDPILRLYPLKRTEFMWSRRGNIKSIQIEEIIDPASTRYSSTRDFNNRYVHARWDCSRNAFIHFDGAILSYNTDLYQSRLFADMKNFDAKAHYKKLFRIDAPINLDIWCKLVTKYFDSNELVLEYLGGAEEDHPSAGRIAI